MKKIVLALMLSLIMSTTLMAQSGGFRSNRYYRQQYSISDIAVGQVYYSWDAWGHQHAFQRFKRAEWYGSSGSRNIYQWYNGRWQYNWSNNYSYRYNWVYYTKQYY